MQPHRIIPTLDVAEAGHLGLGLGCEPAAAEQLGFEGGEEALGHGVVVGDPIEGRTPASPHRLPNATEVYWLPWSLWWMTSLGRPWPTAISIASRHTSARRCFATAQPTILRLQASSTTAR